MKKGFTLIELLAVILILGIIALIAVPQVTNVIDKSRKGAAETSAEHYIGAVNTKIGLNKLDTDSSNDIKDGFVDISTVEVDMTGEKPTNGTLDVENGTVRRAELEVNGMTVVCNPKGKCNTIDKFVYSNQKEIIKEVSEALTEEPTQVGAYLKYQVVDGKLGEAQGCVNNGTNTLCFNVDEHELTERRILKLFGFDYNNMQETSHEFHNDTYVAKYDNSSIPGNLCVRHYKNDDKLQLICYGFENKLETGVSYEHDFILVANYNTRYGWVLYSNKKVSKFTVGPGE